MQAEHDCYWKNSYVIAFLISLINLSLQLIDLSLQEDRTYTRDLTENRALNCNKLTNPSYRPVRTKKQKKKKS